MNTHLLRGERVRLSAENPDTMAEAFSRWGQNTEYFRMLDSDPPRLVSPARFKEWLEEDAKKVSSWDGFLFGIRTLEGDRLIGFMGLFGLEWNHGEAFVGIGLGEKEDWSQGYGTEAMKLILEFAFTELNLHRVSLDVFSYNPRGIRSYEKAGFKLEGCVRQELRRDGERWDVCFMGILRSEWEEATK